MLTQLTVTNFALVDLLELDFHTGMTVVTGETGAGKSIMLGAIGLTLGDRSAPGMIGDADKKAEVVACFDLTNNQEAIRWLEGKDLIDSTRECILRRVIGADGRSKGFINGAPSNVSDLKALGEMLLDIHSQHEHQSLLRVNSHVRILDEYAGLQALSGEVLQIYQQCHKERNRLDARIENSAGQAARLQLLSYQIEELAQLSVSAGECTSLEAEQKKLFSAEVVLGNCHQVMALCREDESSNVDLALGKSIQLLQQLNIDAMRPLLEMLSTAQIQVAEACSDLAQLSGSFVVDPNRLSQVEDRLSALYNLSRKHRIEVHEIPQLEAALNTELRQLKNIDSEVCAAESALKILVEAYFSKAKLLSKKRASAARKLQQQVSRQLTRLGMLGARFDIALTPQETSAPRAKGLEEIEFLVSTNPGQAPKPLNKIASGGELSRISLAIQVVAADTSRIPTLVFDEVDVGIGGSVAEVVGGLLRTLGAKAQIICVTHLAQVAAQGHQHLLVQKTNHKHGATTQIEALTDVHRIEELARMMGGIEITQQTLAHAQEMFAASQG